MFLFCSVCFCSSDLALPRVHVNTLNTTMLVPVWSDCSPYTALSLCINPHNPSVYLIHCAVDLKPQWTQRADRHQDHFTWRGWADWLTYLEDTFGLIHSFTFVFFALHPDNFLAPLIFPLLSVDVFLNSFSSFPVSSHIFLVTLYLIVQCDS